MESEIFSSPAFQMSLLLFVSLAGYLIASKINQSAVIGEILLGLMIGPSFLGLLSYNEFVRSFAELGVIILLFVIGLEFSVRELAKPKYLWIAVLGVVIPWISGFFVANFFGFSFAAAVLVGTTLTATSVAITANVLKEFGVLQSEAAKAIIGAAVIDDILGLLALSISTQVVNGNLSITLISLILVKVVLFLLLGIVFGIIADKMIVRIDRAKISRLYPEFVFIFAITIAFLYALIAEFIGISAIVGAFIAGVSFSSLDLKHSRSYKEGAEYLHIIFAAIFFVSIGILADLSSINSNAILFIVVLTVAAILSKVVGCGIPAILQKINVRDSLIIGFGMSPRGEVAMIIALIGLNEKIITQNIFVSIIIMSLTTTLVAPIILRNWLLKK